MVLIPPLEATRRIHAALQHDIGLQIRQDVDQVINVCLRLPTFRKGLCFTGAGNTFFVVIYLRRRMLATVPIGGKRNRIERMLATPSF